MESKSKNFAKAFLDYITVEQEDISIGEPRWGNKDLNPTPPEERKWSWWNMMLFWFSGAFGTTQWNIASSLIAVGLSWKTAFISCIIGYTLAGIVVTCMARPGAAYHIGYPVLARAVMGIYGSFFFIFIRACVCIVWYGIQCYYGAEMFSVCLRCIFGWRWTEFPNHLPESAGITSAQLLSFFLMWLMHSPFTFVHPRHIRIAFNVKGIITPIAVVGLFIWCMAAGAGISSIGSTNTSAAKGVPLGWAVMSGINTIFGGFSPMLINQPDLSRYCRREIDAGWPQGVGMFVSHVLVFFMGMASTASIAGVWGTTYWNMWDLFGAMLDHYWTPAGRFLVFLLAFSLIFGIIGTNLGANSIPFGADFTGLFPKYMTIRRGQVLCSILGVCLVPWKLIANAETFLTFLGSYNIFMAPLCGIIIVDYVFAKRGNIHIPSLYTSKATSLYYFTYGVNWRGVFAWFAAVALALPGLVAAYQPNLVDEAGKNMYKMGWIMTFCAACAFYGFAVWMWPKPIYPMEYSGVVPTNWEFLTTTDGYFPDEVAERGSESSEGVERVRVEAVFAKGKGLE